ncbi:MAG: methyltransferase domain-containing protein [Ilumatobacter sp.]|uniref:class I SAM-dependent methyltransferase n=1 Tax=Ilumatobacter sp. TaxID=1967498 RepID=UPI00261316A3|nr:methyltransferase domain-containing protein [Ilumatobacter sp.]MDJ0771740.1 methyltransferase domain-containing protein [Ilumatobacter sp.]
MEDAERGQVVAEAAVVYDEFFVPALFGQWPGHVLDRASVAEGHDVLDVGCGTGVLARAAAGRVGTSGTVTGVDPNPGMLSVARRSAEPVEWVDGAAEDLPFDDAAFDRIVSQFALMFFDDRSAGLASMARALRTGGSIAIATWSPLDRVPGYAAMVELLDRMFGSDAALALAAPFVLGDHAELTELVGDHFERVEIVEQPGTARFESIEAWMHTDIRGWTLADMIDDEQYGELVAAAERDLARFVGRDGAVEFDAPAVITTAIG